MPSASKPATIGPREQMKIIRSDVKRYLHGFNPRKLRNLGEMPTNMDDARRVIIALQDTLEKSVSSHARATELVEGLKQCDEANFHNTQTVLTSNAMDVSALKNEITHLKRRLETSTEYEHTTQQRLNQSNVDLGEAKNTIRTLQAEKTALMSTVGIFSGAATPEPKPRISGDSDSIRKSMEASMDRMMYRGNLPTFRDDRLDGIRYAFNEKGGY